MLEIRIENDDIIIHADDQTASDLLCVALQPPAFSLIYFSPATQVYIFVNLHFVGDYICVSQLK